MKFQRKAFQDARALILSEKPLVASQLEERIASLIPALESSIDSFETYLTAYEHCSETRTVGMFYLNATENNTIPINAIDEFSAPFEAIGSSAGVFIIADSEKSFAESYKTYGSSSRLLGIALEADLNADQAFKDQILSSWKKFENLQKTTAVPKEEMDFILKISARFSDTENLARLTNIITSKLDRSWYDDLVIEASPALLSLPEQQRWILNNSSSLQKIDKALEPFKNMPISELITSKDNELVIRAAIAANCIHKSSNSEELKAFLEQITQGSNSFAPTLKRIITKEKLNILDLFSSEKVRKAA